ncbi:unnamed protein product [Choristocarpus tenellus]
MSALDRVRKGNGERVVFYCASFFKIDGVTLTIRGLVRHLLGDGGSVIIVTSDSPSQVKVNSFEKAHDGTRILRTTGGLVPVPGSDYYMGLFLNEETRRAMDSFKPTVVHITNPDMAALSIIRWALWEQPECVLTATLHTNFEELLDFYSQSARSQATWLASSFQRYLYGLCPTVYVPTEFMRTKLLKENWDTELGVWGRGVDACLFSPENRDESLRVKMGLAPQDVAVLWLGRLVAEKRPDVWLRALKKVQGRLATATSKAESGGRVGKVVGVCVGDGEARHMFERVEGVMYMGWKSGEELATLIASCDVFMFPSKIETFGKVTLEAMASGLPCLVNRECGDHLVQDGENGFTLSGAEVDKYGWRLWELVQDGLLREKMGSTGRAMALKRSDCETNERMVENYRSSRTLKGKECKNRHALKPASGLWDRGGHAIYYVLEMLKLWTALVALCTRGPGSMEVKLCVKGLRKHRTTMVSFLTNLVTRPVQQAAFFLIALVFSRYAVSVIY